MLANLQEELEPGEWLPPESVQTFVIAQVFDQFKDDEAETLGLTLRVLVQGVAVEAEEMNEAMLATLQDAVPEEGQIVAETFCARCAATGDSEILGRTTLFTTTASARYVIPIDPNEVREEGRRPEPGRCIAGHARKLADRRPTGHLSGSGVDADIAPLPQPNPGACRLRRRAGGGRMTLTGAQNRPLPDGKLMALDVGLARIGVAVCDPLGLAARPLTVIERKSRHEDFAKLARLVDEGGCGRGLRPAAVHGRH